MENQISSKTVEAELELEAVIGFNGEASSMPGLGGLASLGRVVPTGTVSHRVVSGRLQYGILPELWPRPSTGATACPDQGP